VLRHLARDVPIRLSDARKLVPLKLFVPLDLLRLDLRLPVTDEQ
jgi:hypothetical protein